MSVFRIGLFGPSPKKVLETNQKLPRNFFLMQTDSADSSHWYGYIVQTDGSDDTRAILESEVIPFANIKACCQNEQLQKLTFINKLFKDKWVSIFENKTWKRTSREDDPHCTKDGVSFIGKSGDSKPKLAETYLLDNTIINEAKNAYDGLLKRLKLDPYTLGFKR